MIFKEYKQTENHRKNMGLAKAGKPLSKEHRNSLSLALLGNKNSLGYKFTEEQKKNTSKGQLGHKNALGHCWYLSNITKKNMSLAKIGKPLSEGHKEKLKESHLGINLGHPCYNKKGGFRKDLNQYFRSTWEANVARILNYLKIKWVYEPKEKRFYFNNCSYMTDFYLPDFNLYIEVKGYLRDWARKILKKMLLEYPKVSLKIIDGEVYKKLIKMYSEVIPLWER